MIENEIPMFIGSFKFLNREKGSPSLNRVQIVLFLLERHLTMKGLILINDVGVSFVCDSKGESETN